MKTYVDLGKAIYIKGQHIPKDPINSDYSLFLEEQKDGRATLVPYTPPPKAWSDIRAERDVLLRESDWIAMPDVQHPQKEAWLEYRQKLRDLPSAFHTAADVIWPTPPGK